MALMVIAAACGDDSDSDSSADTDSATGTAAPAATDTPAESDPPATEPVATGGLQVSGVDFDAGTAQVVNLGDSPVDLTGHWVCNRPNYAELPAVELAPGEEIEIGVVGLADSGGEVAIYTSNEFDNSDHIVSYVQWGSGGGRAPVAEEAGIWSGPPADATTGGVTLTGEPGSAAGWS